MPLWYKNKNLKSEKKKKKKAQYLTNKNLT